MDSDPGLDADAVDRPRVVGLDEADALGVALADGALVGLPAVGGYCLAARAGDAGAENRLRALVADPEGPHYVAGDRDGVRSLTSGWTDELGTLLERCWPGPLEVFVPRAGGSKPAAPDDTDAGGWAVVVGIPDGRALRRLCRAQGPWRTAPLALNDATQVAQSFDAADVALVLDGGERDGPGATLVDGTVSPPRVLREGALPASFIEGAMAMATRRRFFGRRR